MTRKSRGFSVLKKILVASAAVVLVSSLAACSGSEKEVSEEESQTSSIASIATPTPTKKIKVGIVRDIDDFLNIRSDASNDAEIVGTAESGEEFEILTENYKEDWHEISYNNEKAYVYAEFIKVQEKEINIEDTSTSEDKPSATPNPDTPIIVGNSKREKSSSTSSENSGMTTDSIRDTEDPERR